MASREFEEREHITYKCRACGSRNKIYTELIHPCTHDHVGYSFKCCDCGEYKEFFNEHRSNGFSNKPMYVSGKQKCYMWQRCPHRDCPFHDHHVKPHPCHHKHYTVHTYTVDTYVGNYDQPKFL